MNFGFNLLLGRSLKHVKTGKCIHTNGAWPAVDRYMVLWSGCNEQRLELWFTKQGKYFFREFSKKVIDSAIAFVLACKFHTLLIVSYTCN